MKARSLSKKQDSSQPSNSPIQRNTAEKKNDSASTEIVHGLARTFYLGFIPALEFLKVFGTLYNGSASIFRIWVGPSIYQQPWTQWLYYPNLPPILGAPYSIFWYWFYRLIAWDPLFANLVLIIVDSLFVIGIWYWKGYKTTIIYQSFSVLFLLMFPTDMLIFWLIILGYKYRPFILLAPIVKLPIGAPLWVWAWIWTSPYSIHNPENTLRYALLAVSWTGSIFWHGRHRMNSLLFSLLDRLR